MLDEATRREMRRDADMLRSTNRNGETSMSRVEAFERLFGHLPELLEDLETAEAESARARQSSLDVARKMFQLGTLILRVERNGYRKRAEEATAERDLLRETLAESDLGGQVLAQWEAIAAADADRDRLAGELAEAKRAVYTAQITHARDAHPDRMHAPACPVCDVLVPLSLDMPSRPDDIQEIRRLIEATSEETNDG